MIGEMRKSVRNYIFKLAELFQKVAELFVVTGRQPISCNPATAKSVLSAQN